VMNYDFNFSFSPPWGNCSVTMTSVIGHLHSQDFAHAYRGWKSCSPSVLFEAPIENYVDEVRISLVNLSCFVPTGNDASIEEKGHRG
jgi:DNA topoisomerase-3